MGIQIDKLESRIMPEPNSGCWLWLGDTSESGYGYFRVDTVRKRAHRVYFEYFRGPIPEGYELDHLCRNTVCVNPRHLDPVTPEQHAARRVLASTCPNGHQYTTDSFKVKRGSKCCKVCLKEYKRRRRVGVRG